MSLFDDFMFRALLAGLGVAIAAAPLGCFVVWRRMAYFGDATAHAAILGVAIALAFDASVFVGVLGVSLVMAFAVSSLSNRGYAMDTLLGVMAHSALAVGLVAVSFLSGLRVDLMAYLFGDILLVTVTDLAIIGAGAVAVLVLISARWSSLLTATLNRDLAYAAGLNPAREQMVLTLALALIVAVAMKVVGVLLISALLIIPAAAARPLASTPERMAIFAAIIGCLASTSGLYASYQFDTPAGPSVVVAAGALFLISALIAPALRRRA